jgi:hypothetical protein
MKLMDIDQEHLGIPDTSYDATVTLSSAEFARICRDLSALGESVRIDANKDGVRFTCEGEIGNGSVLLKPSGSGIRSGKVKKEKEGGRKKNKVVGSDDEEEEEEDDVKPKVEDSDGGSGLGRTSGVTELTTTLHAYRGSWIGRRAGRGRGRGRRGGGRRSQQEAKGCRQQGVREEDCQKGMPRVVSKH